MSGFFVTLEGADGSGKSTQLAPLADALQREGYAVLVTHEPGGTPVGERVRSIVLDGNAGRMEAWTEALLFTAARAELVTQVIRPHLGRGGIVLCDRYLDSTLAYQGAGRGLDRRALARLQEEVTGGLHPDLTLWFDVPVETAVARQRKRAQDRLDRETAVFHARVRQGYRELAAQEPRRWVLVDASRPPAELAAEIGQLVLARLRGAGVRPARAGAE